MVVDDDDGDGETRLSFERRFGALKSDMLDFLIAHNPVYRRIVEDVRRSNVEFENLQTIEIETDRRTHSVTAVLVNGGDLDAHLGGGIGDPVPDEGDDGEHIGRLLIEMRGHGMDDYDSYSDGGGDHYGSFIDAGGGGEFPGDDVAGFDDGDDGNAAHAGDHYGGSFWGSEDEQGGESGDDGAELAEGAGKKDSYAVGNALKFLGISDTIMFPMLFPLGGGFIPLGHELPRACTAFQFAAKEVWWEDASEVVEEYAIRVYLLREDDGRAIRRRKGIGKKKKEGEKNPGLLHISHIGSISHVREFRSLARHVIRKKGAATEWITGTTALKSDKEPFLGWPETESPITGAADYAHSFRNVRAFRRRFNRFYCDAKAGLFGRVARCRVSTAPSAVGGERWRRVGSAGWKEKNQRWGSGWGTGWLNRFVHAVMCSEKM